MALRDTRITGLKISVSSKCCRISRFASHGDAHEVRWALRHLVERRRPGALRLGRGGEPLVHQGPIAEATRWRVRWRSTLVVPMFGFLSPVQFSPRWWQRRKASGRKASMSVLSACLS